MLSLTSGEVYRRGRRRSFLLTAAFVLQFCLQNAGYRSSKYPMGAVVMQGGLPVLSFVRHFSLFLASLSDDRKQEPIIIQCIEKRFLNS
ncbi:hypothetical protein D3C72_1666620 [compost metagenome]